MKNTLICSLIVISTITSFCASGATTTNPNLNLTANQKKFTPAQKNAAITEKSTPKSKKTPDPNGGSWYISWGYNLDYWSNSNIHVAQPGFNNNFTVHQVRAGDDPGWTSGLFNESLMGPQYNIRIGHFVDPSHKWAIEFSFDHAKYNTNIGQVAPVTGTINGQPINADETLTSNYFYYALHNGANLFMINAARFKPFYTIPHTHMKLTAVGKFGVGVVVVHPENTIMGNTVDVGQKTFSNAYRGCNGWWQMGGWTTGLEGGFRLSLIKGLYLEITNKEAYLDLNNIQVYAGRADQTLWLNESIFNLGWQF